MVVENLNPLIQEKHGKDLGIPADHVIGVSVLLKDRRTGKLYKRLTPKPSAIETPDAIIQLYNGLNQLKYF